MEIILDLNNSNQKIELSKGHYKIDIVGGWGVKLNSFKLFFENINMRLYLNLKKLLGQYNLILEEEERDVFINLKLKNMESLKLIMRI